MDAAGNAYVTGETSSFDFPTTPGALDTTFNQGVFDAFITKLNAAGSSLLYSTYLGGTGEDFGYALAIDALGSIYVGGYTESPTFPTTHGVYDTTNGGLSDAFVTKLHVSPQACGCFSGQTISTAADGAYDVFAVDFDRDGDTDVLSASNFDKKFAWYENNGSQSFTPHTINADWTGPTSVFAADRDGDGDTDVLFAASGIIGWFVNNGNQGFSGTHIVSNVIASPRSVYAKDVDGDGDMDVLSASAFDDKIAWYENVNNAFFSHVITTAANGAQSVIATDVDDDGDIDVLSASRYDNKIAWYENNGSEVFTPRTITTSAVAANSVYAADVDGDGDIDVLSASYGDNKVAWYENDGNQNFTTRLVTNTFANIPKEVSAADLDGDGDTDVLSASIIDNRIAWYRNDGGPNPTFTPFTITTAAGGAESVFAADMDGDGDTDVLSASTNDDKIAWYKNLSFQVVNANDSGSGSLRQAILDANLNPGVDTITFDITTPSIEIRPFTALPPITDPVIIDGTTQPGYAGTPLISISGVNAPSVNGLQVTAGNSTIKGLSITSFSTGTGIRLETGGGNVIVGNYIGVTPAGLGSSNGIGIVITSSSNTIGGTTAGAGNRIASNANAGVLVDTGVNNAIRQNQMYLNGSLGIDLINGGNNNQNKPSVNAASAGGGTTNITASLVSAPSTTHTLDFFSSPICNPSTFGEGETYLGSKTLTTKTTGRGRTVFVAGFQVPVGHVISATATSPGNDTSEFAKCLTVT